MNIAYKRVLIKLSGESLAGKQEHGMDFNEMQDICDKIKSIYDLGVQIAIVVGGGNFWRGRNFSILDPLISDQIGMVATVMNALALSSVFEKANIKTQVQTATPMEEIAETFTRKNALKYLDENNIVIIACGTGNPCFTSDTAAVLRAIELNADIVLKATNVDGIYDKDPKLHIDAIKYNSITFTDVINKNLLVMDSTAAVMCRDHKLRLLIFSISEDNCFLRIIREESIGSLIV